MKLQCISLPLVALAGVLLAGCAQPPTNQQVGAVTGTIVGGVIGSQFGSGVGNVAATIGGAAIGGMIGSSIGQSMDEADRIRAQQAMAYDYETSWQSNRGSYSVTPNRVFMTPDGRMCRNFVLRDTSGSKVNGTACCVQVRSSDGKCLRWNM